MTNSKVVAALAVSAALASGCGTGVDALAIPTPPPAPPTPTTVAPLADGSGVVFAPVPGQTTTTTPTIGPGHATIAGTVLGPAGPVGGATVEATRVVGGAGVSTQAVTAPDGSFTIAGVFGGVYRIRAWQAPSLALTSPQVFFLDGTGTKQVSMTLDSYSGVTVDTSMAPQLVGVGGYANLVVAVDSQVVGPDGVVRPTPVVGQPVQVDGGSGWAALTPDPSSTDASGRATIEFECAQVGAGALVATVAGAAPATVGSTTCVEAAPTTTTLPGSTGGGQGGAGTGQGGQGGPSTTTTP